MPAPRTQARRPGGVPLGIAVSLIAALSLVSLALSYLALTGIGSGEHPGHPVRLGAIPSEAAVAPSSSTPVIAASEATEEQTAGAPQQRMLALDAVTFMRATGGTCANPGVVEISVDTGQSWTVSDSLASAGATQILRLLPSDPSPAQVIALDTNCEPQVYQSADLGSTWEGPFPVAGTWYFDPSDPTRVGSPDGPRALPCIGAELAAAEDRAAVRCLDGAVVETVDRGLTWVESPDVTDALAIGAASDSFLVAEAGGQACAGLWLTTLGSAPAVLDGCFELASAADETEAEGIAIAHSDSSTVLWVGNDLFTSSDRGETWL